MKIAIGCDHGGFTLKEAMASFLEEKGYTVQDMGCYNLDSVDYPDYAFLVGEAVASGQCDRGIVICTTGEGVCISANKVRGVRCSLCTTLFQAEMTRRHNDANVLALGAKVTDEATAKEIAGIWLTTEAEGGRHARRVNKITEYENNH